MPTKRTFVVGPHRNDIVIHDYDEETGYFFVTIVKKTKRNLLGRVRRFKDPGEAFFPSWKEAHAELVVRAKRAASRAEHMAQCARADVDRVLLMVNPNLPSPQELTEKMQRDAERHRARKAKTLGLHLVDQET